MKIILYALAISLISLSTKEIQWIGEKVFQNECADEAKCLIEWNEGEDFISLGIGHFIWYPAGKKGPFEESFPELLGYLKSANAPVPVWLDTHPAPPCPWSSRDDFLKKAQSPQALELRKFLLETKNAQAAFLIKRLEEALPKMVASVAEADSPNIVEQFDRLSATPAGVFALTDYINFKGLGINTTERYNGRGWGLLQVLGSMKGKETGPPALEEFVSAAKDVLTQRVDNSPPERNERKWLPGWLNRVNAYLKIINDAPDFPLSPRPNSDTIKPEAQGGNDVEGGCASKSP